MRKFILSITAILMVLFIARPAFADIASPPTSRISGSQSVTFYSPGPVTTSGTSYTGITYYGQYGGDASNVGLWSTADTFVSAAISGTAFITVTPQFSNDWINWRSAQIVTVNTVSGTTSVSVANVSWSLSSSGTTGYMIPTAGDYIRYKIDITTNTNTVVTPTIRTTFRNWGVTQ